MNEHNDNSDALLFQQLLDGVKPLEQDTIPPHRDHKQRKSQPRCKVAQNANKENASFYFSDEFEAYLADGPIAYIREGHPTHQLKQLRRGDFAPELLLDLHGMTKQEAKRELAALLSAATADNVHCVSVMHGKGKRILQQQLPHWLIQHPDVIAIHQAPKVWGGSSAILVLLRMRDDDPTLVGR